jgi:hypothetical protein
MGVDYLRGTGLLLSTLLVAASPVQQRHVGLQASRAAQSAAGPTYPIRHMRSISVFGARLSMRLEDAGAALVRSGLIRQRFPQSSPTGLKAQVLEADYRHPRENTTVGLFYAELSNGERRVSRIVLWEQIPVMKRGSFDRFLTKRYGAPTAKGLFQGHDNYLWSQEQVSWSNLLPSLQCMMDCIPQSLVGKCTGRTVSRQVVMSGEFNTNMPGKLYWGADINDFEAQRSALLRKPVPRKGPICPVPVA